METADNFVERLFGTAIVGGSLTVALRNCGVVLGVIILAYTALTVLFIFVQEGMIF